MCIAFICYQHYNAIIVFSLNKQKIIFTERPN